MIKTMYQIISQRKLCEKNQLGQQLKTIITFE